jgi:glycosyltransferase involved in cell wall biosynthesis
MHVMHVINSLHGGGAESSILEVAPGLELRGVRTSIVTLLPDDGGLEDRLKAVGVKRTPLRHRDPLSMTLELRDVIRSQRPDLLHTTLLFANLAGRIAASTIRTPVVTTLANRDYGLEHRSNSRYGSWGVRAAQSAEMVTGPLTKRFHAVSHDIARVMSHRLRIPSHRIQVIYRGRDPGRMGIWSPERRLRVRAALSVGKRTPLVLSVGRLDRQKNVETTIEAFRYLCARVPDAVLLVAGRPGDALSVVQARADGTPAVRLLGHRPDVPDLMCASDVLSFPSRWEGLPGTLIEAMALRLAIVGSDIAPVAEAIGDIRWPLVRPDDSQAVADGLASVLVGGIDNEAKKDAGELRFRTLFTAEAASARMFSLYQSVIHDRRTGRVPMTFDESKHNGGSTTLRESVG